MDIDRGRGMVGRDHDEDMGGDMDIDLEIWIWSALDHPQALPKGV